MSKNSNSLPNSVTVNGISIPNHSVHMIRPSLADVGEYTSDQLVTCDSELHMSVTSSLPTAYQLRAYCPGDERNWLNIISAAEEFFTVEDSLFHQQFGEHIEQVPDRMFFIDWIDKGGRVSTVGTATAWWKMAWMHEDKSTGETIDRGEWAQVHWVAVDPKHQGNGLTKPIMDQVMLRMAQSHARAMLGTSTARIWALKVYLDLGFAPDETELQDPAVKNAWAQVQKVLMHPLLKPAID